MLWVAHLSTWFCLVGNIQVLSIICHPLTGNKSSQRIDSLSPCRPITYFSTSLIATFVCNHIYGSPPPQFLYSECGGASDQISHLPDVALESLGQALLVLCTFKINCLECCIHLPKSDFSSKTGNIFELSFRSRSFVCGWLLGFNQIRTSVFGEWKKKSDWFVKILSFFLGGEFFKQKIMINSFLFVSYSELRRQIFKVQFKESVSVSHHLCAHNIYTWILGCHLSFALIKKLLISKKRF